jgi:hypothetical protein
MTPFEQFKRDIETELLSHPVIRANAYPRWFRWGGADERQVADLLIQFSVFSNHFLVVQAKRLVMAATEEGERCARDILMNECGVALDRETGSPEGRRFTAANAHINWLREAGDALGLDRRRLGRWSEAHPATRAFLRGLDRTYASPDPMIGAGASFAVESWAAFGLGGGPQAEAENFWRQLIAGLEGFNRARAARGERELPLGFFKYHAELESGHGAAVWRELREGFDSPGFKPRRFLEGGRKALDAVHAFWEGLDASRRRLAPKARRDSAVEGVNIAQWAF